MVKIYFIVDINGLVYVGSTSQELKERFTKHKYDKKNNYYCSSKLLDLDNAYIECIEECTEDNRKEREQYWINYIDCVNKRNTTFDYKQYQKEYSEKNRENKKVYMKEYRAKNQEKIKENKKVYMKEYREKNKDKIKQQMKEYYQKKKLANSN